MRMRRWFTGILAVTLAVVAVRAASAKGTADRILVSGPGIDGALAITDRAITSLLSVGALEDFMAGAVEPPADLSEGYALQRQFAAGAGAYQTFDRVKYHPDPEGGRGYIYYEGIENGWSEYDEKWFRATREGDAAMRRLLAGLAPYLVLMENEGVFQFLDPVTLETAVRLQVGTAWAYPTGFTASYDGQRFYFGQHTGPTFEQRAVDLATPANCRLTQAGSAVMENVYGDRLLVQSQGMAVAAWDADTLASVRTVYTGSDAGARLFPSDELTWVYMVRSHESDAELTAFDMRTLDFAPYSEAVRLSPVSYGPLTGAWDTRLPYFYLSDGARLFHIIVYTHDLEAATTLALDPVADTLVRAEIAGAHNGSVFMYYPVGGYRIDALFAQREGAAPGGVFVVNANTGRVRQRWHEDLAFAQVIRGGDHIYALQAADDGSATVYGMALADGEIVATRDLPPGAWTLAYAHLDPGLLVAAGASTALDCPTVEPTLAPTLAVTPPATATPAPR